MAEPKNPSPPSAEPQKPQSPGSGGVVELEGTAKIKAVVAALPKDTPDSHVMFGYGGHKVTVGDLKKV